MNRLFKYKVYCQTDSKWEYIWLEEDKTPPSVCPHNSSHVIDENSVAIEEVREPDLKHVSVSSIPAFASKTVGAKKLYKRVVGITESVEIGSNTITWTCTFPWAKFLGIEFVNCKFGDIASLYILDTATGTYSTIPNYTLNQFGFNVCLSDAFYVQRSEFDADIYGGLQIKIVYSSVDVKNIGINLILNEVKD